MKFSFISLGILFATLGAASADTEIGSYQAVFSKKDFVSSSGATLSGTAAVIQQDRANFHKFKKRDEIDTSCGFFSSAANRSKIPAMVTRGGISNKILGGPDEESLWKVTIMENKSGDYYLVVSLIAG